MYYRSYKYRIYPNTLQSKLIDKTIGSARFVYNMLLDDCKKQYEQTGKSFVKTPVYLKKQYEWLKDVDSLALCNARMNLHKAYMNFFKKRSKFPKFHSKKNSRQTYTTNNIVGQVRIEKNGIRLPKVGIVKTVFHRYCYGVIKSATVIKTKTGKYFVSITTEHETPKIIESNVTGKTLGIDMSFHGDFAVYSDGMKAKFPNWYLNSLSKLKYLNRKFSRTKINSIHHEKLRLQIARVYEKISNQLKDWQEKESLRISSNFDVVCVEDINLQSMAKMHYGKKVQNNSFGHFRILLERKTKEHLHKFIKADRWFPSSQICHNCGFRNKDVKNLSITEYDCPKCGTHHDRDINASLNLKLYGEIVSATEVLTPKKSACGETCKTCNKVRCTLNQAGFDESSKIIAITS